MAEKKPSSREQVKQIIAQIEGGIQKLFQSDQYAEYLRTMSRFHTYSYNNAILIHMQMPSATRVAGFNKWKNQFGRHVKRGEKGLTIIAPTPFKKKIEEMKLDPETKAPVLDLDGNAIIEEKEIEIPLFRPVKVFDVSQTEGRPLPSLVTDLTGSVQHYEAFMEALRRASPVPISFQPLRDGMDGFFRPKDQTITIREGMGQVQTVCAAVHEITHAMLHNREQTRLTAAAGDESKDPPKPRDKNTEEVEAESVSYTVCQYFGIETSANSLGYIATWSKDRSLPELKASLETISKAANILITDIDRHFAEICKERGIERTAPQPEQGVTVPASDTLEQFAADLYDYMNQLHQAGILAHPLTLDTREESIADLVAEMQAGNFDGVRTPLNYAAEHTDQTEAKTMLERLDKLISVQNTPVVERPDTPERFMGDMMDLMDRLYQAGLINRNFPPDNREQIKADQIRTLRKNPSLARAVLEKFIREDTGAAEAKVLLERLDGLIQTEKLAATRKEYAAEEEIPDWHREHMEEMQEYLSQDYDPQWDTTLDKYPVPDNSLTLDGLVEGDDLLPLSPEQAAAFLERDMTIYMVEAGKEPAMVFDQDELSELPQGAVFAVPREEWEESPDFRQAVLDRMQHQEEREQAFLDHGADCFAIYQIRTGDDTRDIHFESLDWLKSIGRTVERNNYDLVYTAPLSTSDSVDAALGQLWYQFNNEHPADFQHPSMSVSDIIAIKRDGVVSCHYCDSVGYVEVPDFLTPKPTVAELEAQVKAGQQISLMDLADATHRERGQKKSVVAQLKNPPRQGPKKTAPKKSAEKEI